MTLETPRLILRPFEPGDVDDVHFYASDPAVCFFTDWGPNSREETEAFVAQAVATGAPENYAITLREDMPGTSGTVTAGTVIGGLGAFGVGHAPIADNPTLRELGWVIRRDLWGRRIATEAVEALIESVRENSELEAIHARCRPQNRASSRVMEHVGMIHVRRIERDYEVRGAWVDSDLYVLDLTS